MRASIVLGLGYGDEGKGLVTDYLCSHNPEESLVIRFSGGQQCGHNVVIGEKSHIHSSFGSGTLRGVPSYFTEDCTVYLPSVHIEKQVLKEKGVTPKLTIHPLAKLTTPYDVAFNRFCHNFYGTNQTVGLGVGATMSRDAEGMFKLNAVDLANPYIVASKLDQIRSYYTAKIKAMFSIDRIKKGFLAPEAIWTEFLLKDMKEDIELFNNLIDADLFEVKGYDALRADYLIFEGSQGILLDKDHGVFPYVTYANTTSKNAMVLCDRLRVQPQIYYVTRAYQTRHGEGPMSGEILDNQKEWREGIEKGLETNIYNKYQGHLRRGRLSYDDLNYAMDVDRIYNRDVLKHMVVTCMDHVNYDFQRSKIRHNIYTYLGSRSPDSKYLKLL